MLDMDSLDAAGQAPKRKLADESSTRGRDDNGGSLAMVPDDIRSLPRELDKRVQVRIDRLEAKNAALEGKCQSLQLQIDELSEFNARAREEHNVRCDSLERSIKVLKKDVKWRYSAPDIQHRFWVDNGYVAGYGEQYARSAEELINGIKTEVEDIRNGDESNICECLDNEGSSILHDDVLMPHFEELADAIQLSDGIELVTIGRIEVHSSTMKILGPAMENKVKHIDMQRIAIDEINDATEFFQSFSKSIKRNIALEQLTWSSTRIPSDENADLLIQSIIDNRSINTVCLRHCFNRPSWEGRRANGSRALTTLMTSGKHFHKLDFEHNVLSGIDDVAAALTTNPPIKILNLSGNELNDSDAELIAQALKHNTNLREFYISRNKFTSAGLNKIRATIYDPSSLKSMESSNHTCWVVFAGNVHGISPQQRRDRKLYELLSDRNAENSNVRHLDTEFEEEACIIKVVPIVLECIKRFSIDRATDALVPLSIFYELIRNWKIAELFAEHN